jgi:hypothetical protein
MLLQELKKLKLCKELVTIARSCGDEDITGCIELINAEVTMMSLFDVEGVFDGYTVFYTHQIFEVFWGNREHRGIALLVQKYGKKDKLVVAGDTFIDIIDSLTRHYASLCIYTDDESSYDVAVIENRTEDWVKIKTFGSRDSLSSMLKLLQVCDITRVDVDSPYQNKIVELNKSGL